MFQSIRGMQDSLPTMTPYWAQLEAHLKECAQNYAYQEIRFPIVENTELFQHSLGTVTDIIEKEMYQLKSSPHEQSLSLRPEGTASCVRAAIEHQLLVKNIPQRLWYLGPMFRHERPQKGRYRQFHQFGVEAFGIKQPEIDLELIALTHRLWKTLNIQSQVHLEINSLGSYEARKRYHLHLFEYFKKHINGLDEDSKRRLYTNPLRILDSKNPKLLPIKQNAPKLLDYLDEDAALHFATLQNLLHSLEIPFTINPYLIRGLDYYNKTVFEWVIQDMKGAQNTLCAGGRYDGLVKKLGGPLKPAVGFAIGLERLLALWIDSQHESIIAVPHLYIIKSDQIAMHNSISLSEKLRDIFPSFKIHIDYLGGHFSQQFKRANIHHASIALVLGEKEISTQTITLKHLQTERPQIRISWSTLISYLQQEVIVSSHQK